MQLSLIIVKTKVRGTLCVNAPITILFFSEGLAKAPYCVVVFEQHYAQWNPVKSGCINGENKNLTDLVFVQARLKWP